GGDGGVTVVVLVECVWEMDRFAIAKGVVDLGGDVPARIGLSEGSAFGVVAGLGDFGVTVVIGLNGLDGEAGGVVFQSLVEFAHLFGVDEMPFCEIVGIEVL